MPLFIEMLWILKIVGISIIWKSVFAKTLVVQRVIILPCVPDAVVVLHLVKTMEFSGQITWKIYK